MPNVGASEHFQQGSAASGPDNSSSQVGLPSADVDQLIHRTCPQCGTTSGPDDVLVRAPVRAESLDVGQRDDYWRGFRSRSCFFDFARCRSCSLLYCPTYFSEASLDRLYGSMPDNTAGASPVVLSDTQSSYIRFLSLRRPLSGTYLEIGPDIGLATQAACAIGTLQRAILIEPNRSVHDQLRQSVGRVPVEIAENLSDLAEPAAADAAVLVHVLDHLIDPVAYLHELKSHMKPGGHLLAVVHNEASLLRRVLGVRWPPFCLQHPQLYSPETLGSLLRSTGFDVLASAPTKNAFPLRHVVSTAASLVGIDGKWTRHVSDVTVRLRLGNIMMVARA